MRKIEFTKDFATHKKGDVVERDSMLCRSLINEGVAKYFVEKPKTKKK
jgi:hypothetical protein